MKLQPEFALSIKRPWSGLIVLGLKDVENRSWHTGRLDLPARIYVHAPKVDDDDAMEWLMDEKFGPGIAPQAVLLLYADKAHARGAIVGEVTVVDCVREAPSDWFFGPYGWVLEDAVKYEEPVPCRGKQLLWKPDTDTLARLSNAKVKVQDHV